MSARKALALTAPGRFEALQRDPVAPGPGEVQLAVRACSLCDTDARLSAQPPPFMQLPLVMGHQVVGEVVTAGEGVDTPAVGEQVLATFLIGCGECHWCRAGRDSQCADKRFLGVHTDGGLGPAVTLPARCVSPLPADCDAGAASLIGCGYATPFRALRQGGVAAGDTVLLIGRSLWVLAAVDLATAMGVTVLVAGGDADYAAQAQRLGARAVYQGPPAGLAEWLAGQPGGPVERVIDFEADGDTTPAALAALPPGGTVVYVGHADTQGVATVPFPALQFTEVTVTGCCLIRHREVAELATRHAAGALHPERLVTRRVALDAAAVAQALETIRRRPEAGIVVEVG